MDVERVRLQGESVGNFVSPCRAKPDFRVEGKKKVELAHQGDYDEHRASGVRDESSRRGFFFFF